MNPSNDSNEAQGLPPQNTFPAYGANPIDPSTPSAPLLAQRAPPTAVDTGTQTHRPRTPSVSFSSRIEVRGPDAGSQGPPNGPPGNPPVAAAAASPEPPGGESYQQASRAPPPPATPAAGVSGPSPAIPVPFMAMNQPAFVIPGQQPFLWVNPPVVSSAPTAYPGGYRSTQHSPYWTDQSHWLTNPPQQQQQQQYVYVAGAPVAYAYAQATFAAATPTFYYM